MYKKTITYMNLNNEEVTETLHFNLSKNDAIKLIGKYTAGSLDEEKINEYIDRLLKSNNTVKMIEFIEDFILSSYGEKSEDGNYFVKNKMVREKFENSIAYAELFEELFTNNKQLNNFIKNVVPNFSSKKDKPATASVVN